VQASGAKDGIGVVVYPLLAGDGALPHHQVEALVGALGGPRHESLPKINNQTTGH